MLNKARENVAAAGVADRVIFVEGAIDDPSIPTKLGEGTFDYVMSNGVYNLSPRKDVVFSNVRRLLAPGGRLLLADMMLDLATDTADLGTESWAG
jgi:SAM-dependent methyltransferase